MQLSDVDRIAVLGAGNMGHGIAEVAALAGYDVKMRDIDEEIVREGYDQIEWSLNKLAEKDRISAAAAETALGRVTPVVDLQTAVEDADVVIEAVPETMEIKTEVYTEVDRYAPENAVFASNTSSLSITELSEVTDRPSQFCGMHFFNPPVRMQLVEVISGAHTDGATLSLIEELAESMGKTPVRVRVDSPGFVVNRVLVPLMNEAAWIVETDAATIPEVDSTSKFGIGLPMGAFELTDQVGIDVGYHVLEYMHDVLGDAYRPCPLLAEKIEAGELGKKAGTGFYEYDDGAVVPSDEIREDVERRLLAIMANEVAGLVENDVADVDAIDEAVELGAGFPDGPATLANAEGLDVLVETLDRLHDETGEERYVPVATLREAADSGGFGDIEGDDGGEGRNDGNGTGGSDHPAGDRSGRLEFETITVTVENEVGHVELDRPHRLNTISSDLLDELADAVDYLDDDSEVRSILVTGTGDRAFSAGADVQSMAASGADPLQAVELTRSGQETFERFEEAGVPVVAGIDGYCLGGGMELAAAADFRIASERSEFGQPEHDLGIMPGFGGTQRLPRIVGEGRAKEIIFTADRYDAETMAEYGFLTELVPSESLLDRAHEFAAEMASGPPIAQEFTKRAIHRGRHDTDAGLEIESQAFGHLMSTDDMMAGVTAFLNDEEPTFEGR